MDSLAVGQAKMEKATRVDLKESFVWGLDLPDGHPDLTVENPFREETNGPHKCLNSEHLFILFLKQVWSVGKT